MKQDDFTIADRMNPGFAGDIARSCGMAAGLAVAAMQQSLQTWNGTTPRCFPWHVDNQGAGR